MTTEVVGAACRHCHRPIYLAGDDQWDLWNLVYREYDRTRLCDAREDGPHEPEGPTRWRWPAPEAEPHERAKAEGRPPVRAPLSEERWSEVTRAVVRAVCRHCHRPIYLDNDGGWNLAYRKYDRRTRLCDAREDDKPHAPEGNIRWCYTSRLCDTSEAELHERVKEEVDRRFVRPPDILTPELALQLAAVSAALALCEMDVNGMLGKSGVGGLLSADDHSRLQNAVNDVLRHLLNWPAAWGTGEMT